MNLLTLYNAANIIMAPLPAVSLLFSWWKIRNVIKLFQSAIKGHREELTVDPDHVFPGVQLSLPRWRLRMTVATSWLNVIFIGAYTAVQSLNLHRTVQAFANQTLMTSNDGESFGIDKGLVLLFSWIVMGAVMTLASTLHGTYLITLLCVESKWRCGKVARAVLYPVAIFEDPQDLKPVYLKWKKRSSSYLW